MSGQRRDLDELLGAYALDAVDPDERAEIERYLEVNPRARAEVAEHREAATMLAFSGTAAPADLWDRIVDQLDSRAPAPGPELARILPMDVARRRRERWKPVVLAGLVAAALAVGAIALVNRPRSGDLIEQAAEQASHRSGSRVVTLLDPKGAAGPEAIIDLAGHGYLRAADLPAVGSDRTYQLWGVVGEQVISLGVLGADPATESFTISGDVSLLAITVEQRGGVAVSEQALAYQAAVT